MLTPFDDFPVHQTSQPIAHTASGDRNHYDRYFFNGYDVDAGLFFAVALGVYPNRQVVDAAVSVVEGTDQRSVFASGRTGPDPSRTAVGPVEVIVERPFERLRVVARAPEHGVELDATFVARTPVLEEPRFVRHAGTVLVMDYTRLVQWGAWEGTANGHGLAPEAALGCRDRSWGVRPVGEPPTGGAPSHAPRQFFWLWAPLNFADGARHFAFNDTTDGRPWYEAGVAVPALDAGGATFGPEAATESMRRASCQLEWTPGTRWCRSATLTLEPWRDAAETIELEPVLRFQMKGIGYGHPEWRHGAWHDELAVGGDRWDVDALDPEDPTNLHIQHLVKARRSDGVEGVGVLEQLAIGPHEPTGLAGTSEGYDPVRARTAGTTSLT